MKIALTDITRCFAPAKHRLIYLLKFSSKLVVRRAQSPHSQKDSQQHIYEFLLYKSNYLLKEKPRQINFLLFIPGALCIMHYPNLNTISTAELYQSKEKRIFE